ncbi:TolB family protein [Dinghuibacter silviterrae]|uniref:Uncharacterized protein n=1 Tax=Dinghuibacter silviterrae TaxID=1539049 RepID=A0A4R8DER6_9BACT|nr:hypothetical protein [Dinghuibacter silviterrae]TDW96041.1 hypothetical protein EDB95_3863 [Dinghuibacter silviterrae]
MKVFITVLFLVSIQYKQFLFAQDVFGGNPASVRWRQLNTDTARIIYPAGMDSQALRVAQIVHYLNRSTGHSIGNRLRKIDIVFQKDVTYENGFVALGPFRSEFYLNPPQDVFSLGSLPPYENLAIHEYRHVQQYTNFDRGFSKVLSYILGQQGQDLGNALTVPNWFFEGDAVFQETLVSREGRGRLPSFLDDFTALWAGNREYTWEKWRNGSYRDLVPNWYPLGFILVSYGRATYGTDVWRNIAGDAAAARGGFYPFQKAVKRYTGLSFQAFRDTAMRTYKDRILAGDTAVAGRLLTPLKKHALVTYQQAFDGAQVVAKAGYAQVPAFYVRGRRLRTMDVVQDNYFSYHNGKAVYAAFQPDLRWGLREYNDIRLLDVRTGEQKTLTHKARYFAPDISADGQKVVAVNMPSEGAASLRILSTGDGHVLDTMPNPHRYFYVMPRWTPDGQHIVAGVRDGVGRMSLLWMDAGTHEETLLLPFSFHVLAYPYIAGDTVFFSARQGQGEQLMAFVKGQGMLYRLTDGVRAYYMPSVQGNEVTWTTPTADGMALYTAPTASFPWTPLAADSFALNATTPLLPAGFTQDKALDALTRLDTNVFYPSKVYHKASHLFNFHSFRPYYSNPDWSFTVYGQNVLNTFQSQVGYDYNQNEASSNVSAGATYGAWYPWISGSVGYTTHRTGVTNRGNVVHWDELQAGLGTSVPLDLSHGRLYQFLTPAFSVHTDQLSIPPVYGKYFSTSHVEYLQYDLTWSTQTQQTLQQIFPHWAHTFSADFQRSTLGDPLAWQVLLQGSVYLPGLWKSHSLVLNGAYQRRDTLGHYTFTNDFPISRGYPGINFPEMYKWGVNYHFPLAYPDAGVGGIVYLLRLRANVLYDQTYLNGLVPNSQYHLRTAGLELYFDTQWWNQLPVSFGIGYYRLLDNNLLGIGPNQFQILLPILF